MSERVAEHENTRREQRVAEIQRKAADSKTKKKKAGAGDDCNCPVLPTPVFPDPPSDFDFPTFLRHSGPNDPLLAFYNQRSFETRRTVCNGPKFESFASVTPAQFHGFLANFATNYAGPLCPVCAEIVGVIREQLELLKEKFPPEDQLFFELLLTNLPSSETLCSLMFPACHSSLVSADGIWPFNVTDQFNATECFTCQFCMTGTMLLQHKVLLDPLVIYPLWEWLNGTLVPNFCAELCNAYCHSSSPLNVPVRRSHEVYVFVVAWMKMNMIPNKFCTNFNLLKRTFHFCPAPHPDAQHPPLPEGLLPGHRGEVHVNERTEL
ncbi:hypothetical protein M3Y99_01360800 [Aphelenchoides fujianensis]|nr:hypothetical protein M3Y99_01360800 [Aphelenchoides fujianensis]